MKEKTKIEMGSSKDADYLLAKRLQESLNREMQQSDPHLNPTSIVRGLDDVKQFFYFDFRDLQINLYYLTGK